MLGESTSQRGPFEADHIYLDHVGRHSFYGFLASMRGKLFRDEESAGLYWGFNRFTGGDPDKRCFNSRPDNRGCSQVNQRYDRSV